MSTKSQHDKVYNSEPSNNSCYVLSASNVSAPALSPLTELTGFMLTETCEANTSHHDGTSHHEVEGNTQDHSACI